MIIERNLPGFRESVKIELKDSELYDAWFEYERKCTVPVLWDMIADRLVMNDASSDDTVIDSLAESAWHIYNKSLSAGCNEEWAMNDATSSVVILYLDDQLKSRDDENTI